MASKVYGTFDSQTAYETGSTPILSVTGNFPLGISPGTFTVEVAGPFMEGRDGTPIPTGPGITAAFSIDGRFLQMFTPETPKSITVGDEQSGKCTFSNLWVDTVDANELNDDNGTHTVTLQDRRVWWHRSGVYGPRSFNGEVFGELPGKSGDNPRYPKSRLRTVRELFNEMFAHLRETNVKLDGEDGFVDLKDIKIDGEELGKQTPAFNVSPGESAASALQRLAAAYDLIPAISPDSDICGLVARSHMSDRIDDTYDWVTTRANRDWDPISSAGTGYDRESLPDVLMLKGSEIIIGDYLTLEPVTQDPDRPGEWIPLFLRSTLEAFGVDFSVPGRSGFTDGAGVAKLAIGISSCPELSPSIPPYLHPLVRTWFQHWRVAQPLEVVKADDTEEQGGEIKTGLQPRDERKVLEEDKTTGVTYTRYKSPLFRLARGATPTGVKTIVTGKTLWEPSVSITSAEPHRWLPLLNHTEEAGFDGQLAPLSVRGANVLRPCLVRDHQGNEGQDWVSVGPITREPERENLYDMADLGIIPTIIDAASGVVDLGEPIYGHDGTKKGKTSVASDKLTGKSGRGRSIWHLVLEEEICNRGSAEDSGQEPVGLPEPPGVEGEGEGEGEGEEEELECPSAPINMPYLVLRCSYYKRAHADERDFTTTYSSASPTRGTDSQLGQLVLPGLRQNIYAPGAGQPLLAEEPSQDRSSPNEIWVKGIGGVQLRCSTSRVVLQGGSLVAHSFYRSGGYDGGQLVGVCSHFDTELVTRGNCDRLGRTFAPVTARHYLGIWNFWTYAINQLSDAITKFRGNGKNIRVLTAEVMGCHRELMPGAPGFKSTPTDSVSVSGSGDAVKATMRFTVNSRGWRPFVGSMIERDALAAIENRAAMVLGLAENLGGR